MDSEHAIPTQQPRECEIVAAATVVNALAPRMPDEVTSTEETTYNDALLLLSDVFSRATVM